MSDKPTLNARYMEVYEQYDSEPLVFRIGVWMGLRMEGEGRYLFSRVNDDRVDQWLRGEICLRMLLASAYQHRDVFSPDGEEFKLDTVIPIEQAATLFPLPGFNYGQGV